MCACLKQDGSIGYYALHLHDALAVIIAQIHTAAAAKFNLKERLKVMKDAGRGRSLRPYTVLKSTFAKIE